jgi:hypothetical protein
MVQEEQCQTTWLSLSPPACQTMKKLRGPLDHLLAGREVADFAQSAYTSFASVDSFSFSTSAGANATAPSMAQNPHLEQLSKESGARDATTTHDDALFPDIDAENPVTELQSLCMNCEEQGTTRLLLTRVPFFRDVILMSFHCPHCNWRNTEVQSAETIAERVGALSLCHLQLPYFSACMC